MTGKAVPGISCIKQKPTLPYFCHNFFTLHGWGRNIHFEFRNPWHHSYLCKQSPATASKHNNFHLPEISAIKVIGGGGSWVKKSSWSYMKELSDTRQALFTELRKLDLLLRYRASTIAKMIVFYSLAKFQMWIVENYWYGNNLAPDLCFRPKLWTKAA